MCLMRFNTLKLVHSFSQPLKWLFFLFLFPFNFIVGSLPLFAPPDEWEFAAAKNTDSCIQAGFLGKGSTPFRPSMNLAIEEVDVNLKQYLKAVKEIHLHSPGTTWRDLGKFVTLSGTGRLTEISTPSSFGNIKMLQMILIKDKVAYIMTGAAIKEDFLRLQDIFTKSFQSLRLEADLFSSLGQEKKQKFELFFKSIDTNHAEETAQWNHLQTMVLDTPEMGRYWQALVLKRGYEKIHKVANPL